MNPNPENFPLLAFVLSQLNPNSHAPLPPLTYNKLITNYPHFTNSTVISSLTRAVPVQISQTCLLLETLGPRPDQETVSAARSKIAQIQETAPSSPEVEIYRAVLKLEEMHEDSDRKFKEAEEMLDRVFGSVSAESVDVNEDVLKILQVAESGGVIDRIELADRQLKLLPEAFGRLHGLVSLNLSRNLLEAIPDSIAGLQKLEELDVSSNLLQFLQFTPLLSTNFTICEKPNNLHTIIPTGSNKKHTTCSDSSSSSSSSFSISFQSVIHKAIVPLAASATIILLSPDPAKAGFLSGFSGIESVPGPELPQIDFLNRFNEENQKKYAELDARFKESPLLKKLLEKSKQNKDKNRQEIENKYCLRGAEWGVGDCSAEGMSPEEKENFISMLKQKAGVNE